MTYAAKIEPTGPKPRPPKDRWGLVARINDPHGVGIDFMYPDTLDEGVRYCRSRCRKGHTWQVFRVWLRYWYEVEQVWNDDGELAPDWVLQSDETPGEVLAEGKV